MMATPERVGTGNAPGRCSGVLERCLGLVLEEADGWTLAIRHEEQRGAHPGGAGRARRGTGGLRHIYLTHHYSDHVGGLPGVRRWAPSAEVMAPEHEVEIISGKRRPDLSSNAMFRFVNRFQRLPTAPVGRVLRGGNIVAAGFRVVLTQGHTLEHPSLLRN